MIDTPDALQRWRAALSVLDEPFATMVTPLVARLAPSLGPLRSHAQTGDGEPDGYDGLARRGTWDRLLLSEWLLADEMPDEFVRRAAERELGFHRIGLRTPSAPRTSVVLFDAGPTQLGAPRVAHLALLIALAQRAHDAGARFLWGSFQSPPDTANGGLVHGLARDNVDRLLRARHAFDVSPDDLDAWSALSSGVVPWDDVWIVALPAVAEAWRRRVGMRVRSTGGEVHITEAPGTRGALDVEIVTRAGRRSVSLPLPDTFDMVRLLRGPLRALEPGAERTARQPDRFEACSNPVLNPGGSRLVVRTRDQHLAVFTVPPRPGLAVDPPHRANLRRGEVVLAAGWLSARRLAVLGENAEGIGLYDENGRDRFRHIPRCRADDAAVRAWVDAVRNARERLVPLRLDVSASGHVSGADAVAMRAQLRFDGRGLTLAERTALPELHRSELLVDGRVVRSLHVADLHQVVDELTPDTWTLRGPYVGPAPAPVTVPDGHRALAALRIPSRTEIALVCETPARDALVVVTATGIERRYDLSDALLAVSCGTWRIVCVTVEGRLRVYDPSLDEPLLDHTRAEVDE